MASVDSRVVQMQFDNASFEKGVQQSMRSLKNLDDSLQLERGAKGLTSISKAVNTVKFDSIVHGLSGLQNKFDSVFSGIKSTISSITSPLDTILSTMGLITTAAFGVQTAVGGMNRAANLEQAKFQLRGLGYEFDDVYGSIEHAVMGTPFGMDAAAKASAQLLASGVQVGEAMDYALRGISGVAVMADSSYEDIAHIFTTVAGQGRLMGHQLDQLSSRGLNAAATLASYFKVTEAELREMVSRGEVDFASFARAMDEAFGEHSTKANETFSGAFANMKGALSRLGGDFMIPIRELGRRISLGIRAMIDAVIDGVRQVHDLTHYLGAIGGSGESGEWSIVKSFEYNFGLIGEKAEEWMRIFANSGVLQNFISSFVSPMDAIFHGTMINSISILEQLFGRLSGLDMSGISFLGDNGQSLASTMDILQRIFAKFAGVDMDSVKAVMDTVKDGNLVDTMKALRNAFGDPFGFDLSGLTSFMDELGRVMYRWSDFTAKNIPVILDTLADFGGGVFNLVQMLGSYLLPILSGVWDALFGKILEGGEAAENFLKSLSGSAKDFREFTKNLALSDDKAKILHDTISNIVTVFKDVGAVVGEAGAKFISGFGGKAVEALGKAFEFIAVSLEKAWPIIESIGNLIASVVIPLASLAGETIGAAFEFAISKLGELSGMAPDVSGVFGSVESIADRINGAAEAIRAFLFGIHFEDIKSFFKSIADGSFDVNAVIENLRTRFEDLKTAVKDVASKAFAKLEEKLPVVAEGLRQIWDVLKQLMESAEKYLGTLFGSGDSNSIEGKFSGLSKILSNNVFGTIGNDGAAAAEGLGAFNEQANTFVELFETFGEKITKFAEGFGLKDVAVILSGLFMGGVFQGLKEFHKTISNMATAFTSLGSALTSIGNTIAGLIQLPVTIGKAVSDYYEALAKIEKAKAITAMIKDVAISVALLAASMWLLSTIPEDKIVQAGISLGAIFAGLMGLLFGIVLMLKKIDPKVLNSMYKPIMALSAAMLAVAAAIAIMTGSVLILSQVPWQKLLAGTASVVAMMLALGLTMKLLSGISGSIIQAAGAILLLGLALLPLTAAVLAFAAVPLDVDHYTRLFIALTIIIAIMALFTGMTNFMNPAKLASAGAGILAMSAAMLVLAVAAAEFGALPLPMLAKGVGAIAALFVAIGLLAKLATGAAPAILAAGAAMLLMTPAILAMAAAIAILTSLASNTTNGVGMMKQSVLALAGMAVAMMAVIAVLSMFPAPGVLAAAAALLILSGAMIAMAAAISLLSLVPEQALWPAVGAIAALVAVCTVAGAILSVFALGLLAVGAATLMFGTGIWLASTGLAALAGSIVLLGAMGPAAFKMIGLGLQTLATEASVAAEIFAVGMANAINAFIRTLNEGAPQVEGASGNLIDAFIAGANSRLPQIAFFAAGAILAFLQGIAMQAFAIGQAGLQIVAYLVLGIASGIGLLIEAAMVLATEFIIGLARGIQNNGEMIYNAVSGLTGMIFAAFENLIANLIESIIGPNPIADAIRENAAGLEAAANESLGAAEAAADEKMNSMKDAAGEAMGDIADTMNEPIDASEGGAGSSESWIEGFAGPIQEMLPAELQGVFSGELLGDMSQYAVPGGESWAQGWGEGATSTLDGEASAEVISSVEGVVADAEAVDSSSAGNTVGSNFGSGVAAGIREWASTVAAEAARMVEEAKAAANSAMDAQSPAKDLIKSGGYFAQGFMIGIQRNTEAVALAASDMTNAAKAEVAGFNTVINEALTGIDWDSQPTIRPVLDLTDIQAGMGRLDGLMASNSIMQAAWANRVLPVSSGYGSSVSSIQNAPTYNFNLDYGAGDDAVTMFMELASMMQSFNRLEA